MLKCIAPGSTTGWRHATHEAAPATAASTTAPAARMRNRGRDLAGTRRHVDSDLGQRALTRDGARGQAAVLAGSARSPARERLVAVPGVLELRKKTARRGVGGADGVVDLDHDQPVGQGVDDVLANRLANRVRFHRLYPFRCSHPRSGLNILAGNKSPSNAEPNGAQIGRIHDCSRGMGNRRCRPSAARKPRPGRRRNHRR